MSLEVDVSQFWSTLVLLACGSVGAVLSVALLLVIPTDGAPHAYRELLSDDLPVLIFAAGLGFGVGALVALLWSLLQRFFAADVPRA
jgi:hypothetical protein